MIAKNVVFSPSGDRAAIGGADVIRLYRVPDGASPTVLEGHSDAIYHLLFAPGGDVLYSASDDATVRAWDVASGEGRLIAGHRDDVNRLALSADGATLATGSLDSSVRIWPLATSRGRVFATGLPQPVFIEFSRGGDAVWCGSRTGVALRVALATGAESRRAFPVWAARGREPALGGLQAALVRGDHIVLWSLDTGAERPLPARHRGELTTVVLSSDDRRLLTRDDTGSTLLWDLSTGDARNFPLRPDMVAARFFPDSDRLAVLGPGWFEVWDAARATRLKEVTTATPVARHELGDVFISADGTAVATFAQRWLYWDLDTGHLRDRPRPESAATLDMSADGTHVAIGTASRRVLLWTPATDELADLGPHDDFAFDVEFSPDGKTVASSSHDRTVRVWNLATRRRRILRGHTRPIPTLTFSRDGQTVASLDDAGTIRLWPLATLPDDSPSAAPARLGAATTAIIDSTGLATTP